MSQPEKPKPKTNPPAGPKPVPPPPKSPKSSSDAGGIKKPVPPPPAVSRKPATLSGKSAGTDTVAKKPPSPTNHPPGKSGARWWLIFALIVTIPALLIAGLRLFVFQPVLIIGEGMVPFAKKDSHALVNQLAYKTPADVKIGDVVAYVPPDEDLRGEPLQGALWISRVVGLPGEQIAVGEDRLRRNGSPAKRNEIGKREKRYVSYTESLDDQKSWIVTYDLYVLSGFDEMETKVPENSFYLMGDNRCSSVDSRFVGSIPFDSIRGKVIYSSTE